MKTAKDYHIHSTYSKNGHGKSTIEEIAFRANEIGLSEIAITDHGPSHFLYGIKRSKIKEAKKHVQAVRKKYPNLKILFGVEANLINLQGDTDINDDLQENCDIILFGYHQGVLFSSLNDLWNFYFMNIVGKFVKKIRDKQIIKNTNAIVKALYKYDINILTHPGDKIPVDIDKIAKACEETNTILEISNKHSHLNTDEIKICMKYNVKFVIGSDAHQKEYIGSYEKALERAIKAGLDLDRIINLDLSE